MRICLLTTQDLDADPFPEDDWPCDPRPFLPDADWEVVVLRKLTAVRRITALTRQGFDLFFNLCDGAWDESTPGIEVVQTLERIGVPFTGATSEFYEPSREAMKRVCAAWGIDAPAYVLATDVADSELALESLRFPMIVKHPSSYASIGLTAASRVETPGALRQQVRRISRRYGKALIEEFIEGEEYTVLVAENPDDPQSPTTYQPIRYRFPEGETFKHSDVKWVDYGGLQATPVEDPALDARLRHASATFFRELNGAGFGRCDIRVDADGRPFMLEVNANCGVYYPPADAGGADLCLASDPAGHEGFTRQIVEAAFRRHERRSRRFVVRARGDGRYGLLAACAIPPGGVIVEFESHPHELVTRAHVRRHWSEARQSFFRRHAWPLNEEVYVTWGRDPENWTPIRHACDPSAWFEGLNVVARRPLAPGDEITLDYATFHGPKMPSFTCECGADDCRRTIRGDDHLRDFVSRYDGHVSEYVRRKRLDIPRA